MWRFVIESVRVWLSLLRSTQMWIFEFSEILGFSNTHLMAVEWCGVLTAPTWDEQSSKRDSSRSFCLVEFLCLVAELCLTPCGPVDHSPPGSTGFPRQESWSGVPFPSPGNLPNSGTEPESLASPALAGRPLPLALPSYQAAKLTGLHWVGCSGIDQKIDWVITERVWFLS